MRASGTFVRFLRVAGAYLLGEVPSQWVRCGPWVFGSWPVDHERRVRNLAHRNDSVTPQAPGLCLTQRPRAAPWMNFTRPDRASTNERHFRAALLQVQGPTHPGGHPDASLPAGTDKTAGQQGLWTTFSDQPERMGLSCTPEWVVDVGGRVDM
jgi:hypothetical protein